jgi:hypothetical protein
MRLKTLGGIVYILVVAGAALAQTQCGTAAEAKALLVKADKAKALDMFNKGEGGFLDRDLYPFCANLSDGKLLAVAIPNAKQLFGMDVRELKDATGKVCGKEMFKAAQKPEGTIPEASYMFARRSDPKPVAEESFITKVGDIYCGVGYYKP